MLKISLGICIYLKGFRIYAYPLDLVSPDDWELPLALGAICRLNVTTGLGHAL